MSKAPTGASPKRGRSTRSLNQTLVVRLLRTFLRDKLTPEGRLLFWLFLLANATGMASFVVKVYFVWCALASLLLVSIVASRLARVPLTAELPLPRNTTAGARLVLPLDVSNRTTRVARDVRLGLLDAPPSVSCDEIAVPRFEPGESRRFDLRVHFSKRGHFVVGGLRQDTLWPWGLWRDTHRLRSPRSILVYPSFHPLVSLDIPVGRRYQPGGIALTSHVGDSTEFISTREFRHGDSIRNIHWRSWARLGEPVVKEFQEEYFCRIALVQDTFLPENARPQDLEAFEASVSLGAAVANRLALEEYVVDLFAAGPEIYHFQAGRSLAYLENVMDILACLEPCFEAPFQKIEPVLLDHMGSITTTVAILLSLDDDRIAMLRALQDRGSELKVVMVSADPPPFLEHPVLGPIRWLPPDRVTGGGVEDL